MLMTPYEKFAQAAKDAAEAAARLIDVFVAVNVEQLDEEYEVLCESSHD